MIFNPVEYPIGVSLRSPRLLPLQVLTSPQMRSSWSPFHLSSPINQLTNIYDRKMTAHEYVQRCTQIKYSFLKKYIINIPQNNINSLFLF